jgi:hypothetical protein
MIPQSIDSFYTTTITTQSIAKNTHAMPYAKKDIDSFYTTTITTHSIAKNTHVMPYANKDIYSEYAYHKSPSFP